MIITGHPVIMVVIIPVVVEKKAATVIPVVGNGYQKSDEWAAETMAGLLT